MTDFFFQLQHLVSLCDRAHYLRDVEDKHQGHRIAFRISHILCTINLAIVLYE